MFWEPIDTAPKDTMIDLWGPNIGRAIDCVWSEDQKMWECDERMYRPELITHWMNRPPFPTIR